MNCIDVSPSVVCRVASRGSLARTNHTTSGAVWRQAAIFVGMRQSPVEVTEAGAAFVGRRRAGALSRCRIRRMVEPMKKEAVTDRLLASLWPLCDHAGC